MSALLNHNPRRPISWKGRTINQISSVIQKNKESSANATMFRAQPLKIYRRELAANVGGSSNTEGGVCNSRVSSSIDELMRPGGSSATTRDHSAGLMTTDFHPSPSTKQESYGCSGDSVSVNCAATNARRRCRSSGMVRKTYDSVRGDSAYFTNTSQYLVSRSMTFAQNQYRHVRRADASIVTDPLNSVATYSPNGISHCPKTYIPDGTSFYYFWIDKTAESGDVYQVIIPPGYYDVNEFNRIFETVMDNNGHYFIYNSTGAHVYLAKIIYNASEQCVELQAFSTSLLSNEQYSLPPDSLWDWPESPKNIVYHLPDNGEGNVITSILGFANGNYPSLFPNGDFDNNRSSSYGVLGTIPGKLSPSYSVMTYKPSNTRFATQGAVSSSDLVVRRKYDTISRNGAGFTNTYGSQVGSAMAYGVSDEPYTIKAKIGYPNPKTPIFPKWSADKMQCAVNGRVVGICSSA